MIFDSGSKATSELAPACFGFRFPTDETRHSLFLPLSGSLLTHSTSSLSSCLQARLFRVQPKIEKGLCLLLVSFTA
ncbi:hypothetical protein L596_024198 [Steinernema carpocapsae]|uniref:Uncharacterized protein n=1 Tax=Steinernema carpocapsae TaxID=34508 RepID=A0A4U5MGA5_STECR|nr:hypothetical protein L596_024198 [Steinernema carpocapsae]